MTNRVFWLCIFLFFPASVAWGKPAYVATIHPVAAILQEVVGERGEVSTLLPPGASPHAWELRPSDVKKTFGAAAVFYAAAEADGWAADLPAKIKVEMISFVPERFLLKMEAGHSHAGEGGGEKGKKSKSPEVDPHFWLDPVAVQAVLPALAKKLAEIDPAGAETYRRNAERFGADLNGLNESISKSLTTVRGKSVVLDHPCCNYFLERFGLKLIGLIESSPGKEPTPRQLQGLIKLLIKEKGGAVFQEEQIPNRAARIVAEGAGASLASVDPIGGVPGRETYAELLFYNADVFLKALRQ